MSIQDVNGKRLTLGNGRSINLNDEYYQYHNEYFGHRTSVAQVAETSINAAGGDKNIDYKQVSAKFSKQHSTLKLSGFMSKFVPTYQLIELFRDTRFSPKFERTLDLGCGMGVHLRLLKAWGVTDHASGIDIYDICSGFDEAALNKMFRRMPLLKWAEFLQDRIANVPEERWSKFQQAVMRRVPTARAFAANYGHRPDSGIYKMRLKGKPSVDRLIIGNVFDLNEKFDLVTSFASLDWFSTPQIMPKVASLLNDGGFFYAWVTNWWHNISTTNVFGHFPFAPNRMTNEEFQNYLQTNMPAHEDNIIKSLSYFDPTHPTLGDYIQEALKVGLVPLAWRENVLPNTLAMHGGVTSLGIAELDRQELFRAVGDIQTQRPDVRVSDLFSYSRAILFRKAPPSDGLTLSHLEALRREQDFHYRPDNILARGIKTAAERIFAPSKR